MKKLVDILLILFHYHGNDNEVKIHFSDNHALLKKILNENDYTFSSMTDYDHFYNKATKIYTTGHISIKKLDPFIIKIINKCVTIDDSYESFLLNIIFKWDINII